MFLLLTAQNQKVQGWGLPPIELNKDKVVPGLTKHRAMETYEGMVVSLHAFLTSALDV
jgi:hypothetical protein